MRRVPAYPMVPQALRELLAADTAITFHSSSGHAPGAEEFGPRQFLFGSESGWHVAHHDLEVLFTISKSDALRSLFGHVACRSSKVAIALEWTSADTGRRGLSESVSVDLNSSGPLYLLLSFPAGVIRGTVRLALQAFVGASGIPAPDEAHLQNVSGARLGPLSEEFLLHLDGDGSLFPTREEEEETGPLWRFESANWDDITEDDFGSDYVALVINRAHPSYPLLRGAESSLFRTPLFAEAVASWIVVFLWQVREVAETAESMDGRGTLWDQVIAGSSREFLPGSIAAAAAAFRSRGDLDPSSLPSLMASCRRWVDKMFSIQRGRL